MNLKLYITVLLGTTLLGSISCGKKKLDVEKFEAVCAKVAQCDKKFQEIAKMQAMQGKGDDAQMTCQKSLAKWAENKQFSAIVPTVVACLNETKCEELSLSNCFTRSSQGIQVPVQK